MTRSTLSGVKRRVNPRWTYLCQSEDGYMFYVMFRVYGLPRLFGGWADDAVLSERQVWGTGYSRSSGHFKIDASEGSLFASPEKALYGHTWLPALATTHYDITVQKDHAVVLRRLDWGRPLGLRAALGGLVPFSGK
ncbi:MAG TPA: hypothetical protein VK694_03760 [Verrucomicrobiae bacterium]|nr:hypothetical protein [Verrucomicrobiae bacterium]